MSSDSYSILPIIINSSNLISTSQNNKFRYTFPAGSVLFKDSKVAIANISMFYSWFNINIGYNNMTFQILVPNSSGTTTTYTITLPAGFYQISDLNNYLQSFCVTNGLYLINADSQYVYYCSINTDSTYYSVALNSAIWPTSLPSGYTQPSNWVGYAMTSDQVVQFVIESTNNFGTIIGFTAGTYPSNATSTTNITSLSNQTPEVSPVSSVIVTSSLVNNKFANPTGILYSFGVANTSFGSNFTSAPNYSYFIDIQDGSYSYFDITFLDQNFNALGMLDTNILVNLLIKTKYHK